jgi:hypothetical protein
MKVTLLLLVLVCGALAHIQYVEKEALRHNLKNVLEGEDFDFANPFDIQAQENSTINGVEDARFVSAFLAKDDEDWVRFEVAPGTTAVVNAAAWTPACTQTDDLYVNVALLGPLSDSRFQPITRDQRRQYNINFDVPAGYGAVLGINEPAPTPRDRPTLNITLPAGEFPNKWFIPYNSGELCQGAIDWRITQQDNSTGKLGCAFPVERCPGRGYPDQAQCSNSTYPAGVAFCPHFMVGNFCGAKSTWRWINERNLGAGTYYYVYWERNGKEVDVGYMMGFRETLRFGNNVADPACANSTAANIPTACVCGTKNNLSLPAGCEALFPAARARIAILYPLLTNGGIWREKKCNWVNY